MFRSSVRYMRAAVPRTISRSQASSVQTQVGIPLHRSQNQARPTVPTTDRRSTPQLVREFRTAPVLRNEDTGWLHNILEDSSIPIRVANVTKNELTLTDGLVVPSSCIFLNGNVFVWNPPVLDPMNVMPNGKGWEEWTDDVWTILEVVNPRPEILIIGTGETVLPVPSRVRSRIYSLGIQLDVQNTRNASSTYNLLSEEGRRVSAAFLPTK